MKIKGYRKNSSYTEDSNLVNSKLFKVGGTGNVTDSLVDECDLSIEENYEGSHYYEDECLGELLDSVISGHIDKRKDDVGVTDSDVVELSDSDLEDLNETDESIMNL